LKWLVKWIFKEQKRLFKKNTVGIIKQNPNLTAKNRCHLANNNHDIAMA
jgi:hypothetical protein